MQLSHKYLILALLRLKLVKIDITKLKRYKSPGSDEIPAELIQEGGEIFHT
jgi:hypothetical protein